VRSLSGPETVGRLRKDFAAVREEAKRTVKEFGEGEENFA